MPFFQKVLSCNTANLEGVMTTALLYRIQLCVIYISCVLIPVVFTCFMVFLDKKSMTQKYFPGIFTVNHNTMFLRISYQTG